MMLGMITQVSALTTIVEWSEDNVSWQPVTFLNDTNRTAGQLFLHAETCYYFRGQNTTNSNETYITGCTKTIEEEGKSLSAIALSVLAFAILVLFSYLGSVFYKEQNFTFYFSYLFWYMALLVPLFVIRIIILWTDTTKTGVLALLNTLYIVYLWTYFFLVFMLVVYFIVLVLSWLNFRRTPGWKKRKLGEE